ncbi:MAG: MarC family protein [Phycisphaerales bacterium]|nr:MarC family protein [Phycisphaerales bacterium]
MQFVYDFVRIFIPLLVVIDPAGMLPVYLAITNRYTADQRRRIAKRASLAAAFTGVGFIAFGQLILGVMGVRFADFQIAGGILLVVLCIIDVLIPGKPAVNEHADFDPASAIGIVPLAIPLIVGPATMTTSLLLVNSYAKGYQDRFGSPWGAIIVAAMVSAALLINVLLLFIAMWHSDRLVRIVGKNAMTVINKIVMILLAAIAVSLIRQGVMSIVSELH